MAGRKSVCRLLAGNANLVPAMAALCGFARYLERLGVWLKQQGETIFVNRRLARKWAVFGNMFDDSILFADTAVPGSLVYWLMTGHGTVENRCFVAPSVAVLMQALLAIHRFEQEWQAAGWLFCDGEKGGKGKRCWLPHTTIKIGQPEAAVHSFKMTAR